VTNQERLVDLLSEDPDWAVAVPDLADLADNAVCAALEGAGRRPEDWQVALMACSNARIAALNASFRGKSDPTDVLSWPAFETAPDVAPAPRTHLGDIALAFGVCRKDADALGIALKDHATHLIVHGCLHLLGFDHFEPEEAAKMEGMEVRALETLGIQDPYRRRDAGGPRPDR